VSEYFGHDSLDYVAESGLISSCVSARGREAFGKQLARYKV